MFLYSSSTSPLLNPHEPLSLVSSGRDSLVAIHPQWLEKFFLQRKGVIMEKTWITVIYRSLVFYMLNLTHQDPIAGNTKSKQRWVYNLPFFPFLLFPSCIVGTILHIARNILL